MDESFFESMLEASGEEQTAEALLALVRSKKDGLGIYAKTVRDVPKTLAICLLRYSVGFGGYRNGYLGTWLNPSHVKFLSSYPYDTLRNCHRSKKVLTRIIKRLIEMEQLEIYSYPQEDFAILRGHKLTEYILHTSSST